MSICPKCGYRYQVSASEEESEDPRRQPSDCIAGMCPMCQYVLPMRPGPNLPQGVPEARQTDIPLQRSYNGDRILVNKYIYSFSDPKRWDVVVFKFPGDAKVNYIKRLVGLPGEKLRIYQGDVFLGKENAIARQRLRNRPQAAEQDSRDAPARARHELRSGRTGRRRLAAALALVAGQRPECLESREDDRRQERAATIQRRCGRRTPIRGCATRTCAHVRSLAGRRRDAKPAATNSRCFPTPIAPNGGDS